MVFGERLRLTTKLTNSQTFRRVLNLVRFALHRDHRVTVFYEPIMVSPAVASRTVSVAVLATFD